MPIWGWHIKLAKDVADKLKLNSVPEFLFGSVLPDTPWLNYEIAVSSGVRNMMHSYVHSYTKPFAVANSEAWIDEHSAQLFKYRLWQGALTHIVLDEVCNNASNALCKHKAFKLYEINTLQGKQEVNLAQFRNACCVDVNQYVTDRCIESANFFVPKLSMLSHRIRTHLNEEFGLTNAHITAACQNIRNNVKPDFTVGNNYVLNEREYYDNLHTVAVDTCCSLLSVYR